MADRTLTVKIIGDSRSLRREFSRSSREAQVFQARISGMGRSLARGLGAGAAIAGVAGLGVAFRSTIQAAIDFESSFAGVRKTVDATEPQFAALAEGFRELSREIPVSVDELNRIGEAAGQLGIRRDAILDFTRTVADLGATTNLAADEAANALARIANITGLPQDQFDRLGSTIVELGNKLAATEAEIVEMSLRLAGAGKQIGLTEAKIAGFAGALASVGINAEAGGSAFSRVFATLANDVATGGKNLARFAKVSGQTTQAFRQQFERDAAGAVISFIEGLDRIEESGGNVFGVLKDLGLGEVRVRDALLRAAGAGDLFRRSLEIGADAWKANNALTEEAAKRYETTASRLIVFQNRVRDLQVTLGTALLPSLEAIIEPLSEWLNKTENQERVQRDLTAVAGAFVEVITTLRDILRPMVSAVGGLENAVKLLVGAMVAKKVLDFAAAVKVLNTRWVTLARLAALGPIALEVAIAEKFFGGDPLGFKKIKEGFEAAFRDFDPKQGLSGVFRNLDWSKVMFGDSGVIGRAFADQAPGVVKAGRDAGEAYGDSFLGTATPFLQRLVGVAVDAWQRNIDALPTLARSTDPLTGTSGGGTAPRGITVEQRNQWFDAMIGRRIDRTQDIEPLQEQIRALDEIARLIQERLARTKDITRRLTLEDQLVGVRRQQRGLRDQIAALRERHAQELAAIEEQRRQLRREARERAALVRETAQFRALNLGPGGAELIPNAQSLRKTLGSVSEAVRGTMLDTSETRNVLSRIRRVLGGGFGKVADEVRSTIDQMLDDITDKLKNFDAGGRTIARQAFNPNAMLAGLGLSPEQVRELRARLSRVGPGGTVAPRGTGAFGMALAGGGITEISSSIYIDGQPVEAVVTRRQRTRKRRNPVQKRGPSITGA